VLQFLKYGEKGDAPTPDDLDGILKKRNPKWVGVECADLGKKSKATIDVTWHLSDHIHRYGTGKNWSDKTAEKAVGAHHLYCFWRSEVAIKLAAGKGAALAREPVQHVPV
jgi:hypothetical protein